MQLQHYDDPKWSICYINRIITNNKIWRILENIDMSQLTPTYIYYENKSTTFMIRNSIFHKRSKYVEFCHYLI